MSTCRLSSNDCGETIVLKKAWRPSNGARDDANAIVVEFVIALLTNPVVELFHHLQQLLLLVRVKFSNETWDVLEENPSRFP